jgi:hypothetical protein
MKVYDMILGDDLDLEFSQGDFSIDESTAQHINHILLAAKGDYREFPLLGADIARLVSEEKNPSLVRQDAQEELERDGLRVQAINFNEKITVIAEYK